MSAITDVHDPRRRTARACTEPRDTRAPRQPEDAPHAPDDRERPESHDTQAPRQPERAPYASGAAAAGRPPSVCADCDLGIGRHVHLHLRPVAAELGRVRTAVGAALASWGCPSETVDDGRLTVSELVGNAIRHAPEAWITLNLMQIGDRLLVEVTDGASARPVVRRAGLEEEQGRGMYLVQAIASAWGARRDGPDRKTTWCTLPVDRTGPEDR
ncbi:ATP-binding protein [Streptomyces sp. NRRL S-813]|uniref:ATP-binding protein n=1 Tax=Streptomyces sp. NRRL S-813 TaxID=1463919 RepID=UPI00068FC07D|nr:ATP-binding protein [Streptomyces sp. NRRL S-813]